MDVRLSLDEVRDLATRTLMHLGASKGNADAVADVIAAAERDECKSHGLFRLPGYSVALRNGRIDGKAVPVIADLAPAVVQADAQGGFAPLALNAGRARLAEMARSQGIAAMPLVNAYHFAALWYEVEALAELGLVAFAFVNSRSYVAPAGGTKPLFGTNPMAFGWPRKGRPPLVFDQASSASARGEIMIHKRDGKPIPEGWAIDRDGKPTTDPAAALAGAQLPFGGYKGAAIALMVELMASGLPQSHFGYEAAAEDTGDGGPAKGGELLLAMDPARFVPGGDGGAALDHAEQLFARLLGQDGTRLPSDRRYAARRRTPVEGIRIPQQLHDDILAFTK
ncbi:MAG: Ldh family oxidoreductase [Alphaproteobacteria bacterium]|nr:Ldh family oxidoreductase [Alphaproteobacteria bacterium]